MAYTAFEKMRKVNFEKFGKDVAELVDGLTKFTDIHFENKEYESIENLRKMFL